MTTKRWLEAGWPTDWINDWLTDSLFPNAQRTDRLTDYWWLTNWNLRNKVVVWAFRYWRPRPWTTHKKEHVVGSYSPPVCMSLLSSLCLTGCRGNFRLQFQQFKPPSISILINRIHRIYFFISFIGGYLHVFKNGITFWNKKWPNSTHMETFKCS